MIKIGINGFGRIGRLVLREAMKRNDVEVVAVNDLVDEDQLAYLFKYDSVHGKYHGQVAVEEGHLIVDGKKIRVTSEKNPENLKWDEVGATIVIDGTGVFKEIESASAHLVAGAKKVLFLRRLKQHRCLLWASITSRLKLRIRFYPAPLAPQVVWLPWQKLSTMNLGWSKV